MGQTNARYRCERSAVFRSLVWRVDYGRSGRGRSRKKIRVDLVVEPAENRDVCYEERKRQAQLGMIFRREFYIECPCTYRGPAKGGGCPHCGTKRLSPGIELGYPLLQ